MGAESEDLRIHVSQPELSGFLKGSSKPLDAVALLVAQLVDRVAVGADKVNSMCERRGGVDSRAVDSDGLALLEDLGVGGGVVMDVVVRCGYQSRARRESDGVQVVGGRAAV
ncbi:hypothetical protein FOZ60_013386 [Perkinsus olseni]|uniref:Uncharacterized protein n=1 Tax=Perkinsus olseni TaxID=32597 RepID=A0A7J6PLN1_PEROL|nr:hypothetical protein FOZ60_013386 [Perkinsus olseni]